MPKVIRPFTTVKVETLAGRIRRALVIAVQGNKITARIGTASKSQPITVIAHPDRVGRFKEGQAGPTVTGGVITDFNGYRYHTFTASGSLTIEGGNLDLVEFLIVAGGAGGNSERRWGYWDAAGGGAGGVWNKIDRPDALYTFPEGTRSIVVGAGSPSDWYPIQGNNSGIFESGNQLFTAIGGGGAPDLYGWSGPQDGGSGGGRGGKAILGILQGHDGGQGAGGGGGAGSAGQDGGPAGANGGQGTSAYSEWGQATGTGELVNGLYYYAGGGAGLGWDSPVQGRGGDGGGSGNQRAGGAGNYPAGVAGLPNTGGGGNSRGAGGSGIVIIRYPIGN